MASREQEGRRKGEVGTGSGGRVDIQVRSMARRSVPVEWDRLGGTATALQCADWQAGRPPQVERQTQSLTRIPPTNALICNGSA